MAAEYRHRDTLMTTSNPGSSDVRDLLRVGGGTSRRVTAVDFVRNTLRAGILRGELPGDYRLVQTDIAEHLGVSTTPVREAMRDLASEGLIVMDSHRVGRVRKPDWDEMVEIVEMRRSLERMAITRAMAAVTDEELKQAWELADALAAEEDVGSWVQGNIRFHTLFHEATRTTRLSGILTALEHAGGVFVAQAQRLDPEIRRQAVADHFSLLEAYELKDVDRAVEIQDTHLGLPLAAVERVRASGDQTPA